MPTTVQFRRGTTAQNNAFTGAIGEITVDTDKETLVLHDGSTAGGFPLISSVAADPSFSSSTTLKPQLTLKNTTDDATGPIIVLESDRATPADNDIAGTIFFKASDDAGSQTTIATIQATISDVTNSTEDGKITFKTFVAGSDTTVATVDASGLSIASGNLAVTSGTGSTIGNLTLANGSITDSSGTISFGDENLTTTGNVTGATVTYTTLNDGSNNITSTAAELNIMDGDTSATSTTLADADRVVVNDAGTMVQVALTDFETYFETALDTLNNVTSASSLATVGALNSGSITSGFGSIDVGSSAITTTGTITGGIGVFDNIRIDNTAGEIDTSSGNLTIDSAGGTVTIDDNATVTGNVIIDGNLTVNGTETVVNSSTLQIEDSQIVVARTNSADTVDIAFFGHTYPAGFDSTVPNHAGFFRDATNAEWYAVKTYSKNEDQLTIDRTDPSFSLATWNYDTVNAVTMTATGTVTYGSLSDGTITITAFVDEDNMASNSATLVPTQQSVKAYVDAETANVASDTLTFTNKTIDANGTGNSITNIDSGNFLSGFFKDEDNMVSNSATSVASQQSIKAYVDSAVSTISSSGTAAVATTVTLVATNTTAATHYVTFVDAATGNENIRTDTNLTYNPSTNILSTTASAAQYADLAERYSADAEYEPGTVMSFGGDQEITQSTQSHDARVAGVVSTAPAYLMNADLENGTALALQGRTPVKVIGRIHKGDMLVASQTPGVACALDSSFYAPGCVIGKALQSYDSQSVGTIEVVVGRI